MKIGTKEFLLSVKTEKIRLVVCLVVSFLSKEFKQNERAELLERLSGVFMEDIRQLEEEIDQALERIDELSKEDNEAYKQRKCQIINSMRERSFPTKILARAKLFLEFGNPYDLLDREVEQSESDFVSGWNTDSKIGTRPIDILLRRFSSFYFRYLCS